MMTRTSCRDHIRLIVGTLAMALAIAAILAPPAVQSVAKPAFIDVPTGLTVEKATKDGIELHWNEVAGASFYELERSESMSGPFINTGPSSKTSFTDSVVEPSHAYVYRVRAFGKDDKQRDVSSEPSNMAMGTAITFEPDQLKGQRIKAQHVDDVRKAIDAVRNVANMPPANWARPVLNGAIVRAADVLELRSKLKEALSALNIEPQPYTDFDLIGRVSVVRAVHIEELRTNSTRGSSSGAGPFYGNPSRSMAGEFGPLIDLPLVPVHLSILPDRRILFWGRDLALDQQQVILDPITKAVKQAAGHSEAYVCKVEDQSISGLTRVANTTTNLFCSGHSFLPNGNLFVAGGHRSPHFDRAGEIHTNIFNYTEGTWTRGRDMNNGRWYPYTVTLGTGDVLIMAGDYWVNEPPDPPDVLYDPNRPTPSNPTFAPNLVPQVYTPVQGGLRDLDPPLDSMLTQYPYLHLTSNGKVFQAQSGFFTNEQNNPEVDRQSRLLDPKAPTGAQWKPIQSTGYPHAIGSSVLLSGDRVLLVGGFDNSQKPTKDAETINLNVDSPSWTPAKPMRFARTYHTATILPDGKVLVTGGVGCKGVNNIESYDINNNALIMCSAGQVLIPELWDPQSDKWTLMAPHTQIRAYHSVAALLPDGRVLVGGSGLPGTVGEIGSGGSKITDQEISKQQLNAMSLGHNNIEIFSPPYLFNSDGSLAERPVITSVVTATSGYVSDGETFFIGTSGAGSVTKVSLMRLPSVTHGFNQDQRRIYLQPTLTNGGVFVTVPSSPNQCPPGYYMLFVLNSAGVPSVAEIIRVQNVSLFPDDTPKDTASGAGATWEQGIEFSSFLNGQITHIRFWKAPGEPTGGHVGHIWNAATGAELASAQFLNETDSGWQEAQLQTPLPITAGVRYRVTYNIHSVVAKTFNALSYPNSSWPLIGWGSYFSTPAGSFPTSASLSNLFADVRFK